MMDKAPHVAVCLPSMGSYETETAISLAAMAIINRAHGIAQSLLSQQQAGIAESRNNLVRCAFDAGADYSLWVDADMAFDPAGCLRLLQHEKDIVGATYPRRGPPYVINGRPVKGDIFAEELQDMEFLPAGFLLVHMDVFRKLQEPWFFESYPQVGPPREQIVSALKGACNADLPESFLKDLGDLAEFHKIQEGEGKTKLTSLRGEDANFCRKARDSGYQIWCDSALSQEMIHIGKQTVSIAGKLPGLTNQVLNEKN